MKKYILLSALALTVIFGNAQTKLIEKVTRKGNETIIPYEKYVLPNGLTVIIHEDHSDPIVYVDVTYHVGSAREQEGRSGFAHFFEHMMFQGSEHVGDEQHFKIVTEAGGNLNGTTNRDRTNYFEVLPSNKLETAFWLESDRMGYFLDSVTERKFEVQRETVKNERGQNYDNKPYGLVFEKTGEALYPPTHPYSWQTIGYIADLNKMNLSDLKRFFLRWYGPNNATLTVAGDVNPAQVIKLAEKYFGPIPKGPEVNPQKVAEVILNSDRYISYEDNIRAPQINFTFPTVPARHPDEAALDALTEILAGNKNSIFYQNFVKSGKAQFAQIFHPTDELAGSIVISVRTFPNKSLAQMDSLIRASLIEFEKRGVTDDDLTKYKAGAEVQLMNSLSSVQGKGTRLAAYQTYTGNPNYITKEIDAVNKLTKEDIIRVYNTYLKNKYAVVLSVYPKGKQELIAKPDNYKAPVRNTDIAEADEYKNLVYKKAPEGFDRTKQPITPAAPAVQVPEFWTENMANGLRIIGTKNTEVPTITLQLFIEAGHRYTHPSQAGIAGLTAAMLNEGTSKHTAEEIAEILEKMGSSISFYDNGQDIVMNVFSLTKNIDATLSIAEEMLYSPRFDEADFNRVKKQRLESIENQSTQATTIATNTFSQLIYGKKHIMGISTLGTTKTVGNLKLDDIKKHYEKNFSPSISSLVIVGDVSKEDILKKLSFLSSWKNILVEHYNEPNTPTIEQTKIYFVNKEKAPQSEIRIGYLAFPYDATGEFFKAQITNYPLGGAFNGRINLSLREKHGWTYGSRTGFNGTQFKGPFMGYAGVRANATDSSLTELIAEIKNYTQNGITDEELMFTKNALSQSEALKYETASQKAGFIKRIMDYKLPKNYTQKQAEILEKITKEEVNLLAKKIFPLNKMVIVVVGDKSNLEKLTKLGYEVIELDTEGNKLDKNGNIIIESKEIPGSSLPKNTYTQPLEDRK